MKNALKEKLQRGEVAIGTFVAIGHPDVTERLSSLGFDWLLLDSEHGPLGLETMQSMMQAMRNTDKCVPIVRVEWNNPVIIKRSLDIGAYGVLIPWVNTAEEAEAAVRACKYPPAGIRGCGPRRAAMINENYVLTANENLLTIVQIETAAAVKNVKDILAVKGIDAVYIGPTDLSMDMFGLPSKWDDSNYMAAFDTVIKAAVNAGKPAGIYAASRNIEWAIEKGFTLPTVDSADDFLISGARAALRKANDAIVTKNAMHGS
jgi:4-hydroxy-2-oxoheptanedioate aldolase